MKSKFLRILSLILVMSSLLSMFAIFANAEEAGSTEDETEDTEEEKITILYNRTYDEGWEVKNGMTLVDQGSTGSTLFVIDYEETPDFDINYFWRLELNSSDNDYAQLDFGANQHIGTVFEFDVKSDDICNFSNLVSLGTKGTSSATRSNYCLMKVTDNKVYLMDGADPAFELSNSWMRIQIVCDYTYEVHTQAEMDKMTDASKKEAARLENENTFLMYVYYGPADGSAAPTLYTGKPLVITGIGGKGVQIVRFQSTGNDKADNYGTSICFDNLKVYDGANEIPFLCNAWGGENVLDGITFRTAYSDDAIYVLLEMEDNVVNADDFLFLNFKIGGTHWGSVKITRGVGDASQGGYNFGTTTVATEYRSLIGTLHKYTSCSFTFNAQQPLHGRSNT